MNIEIANILYYMHQSIWKILEEYPEKTVDIVKKGVDVSVYFSVKYLLIEFLGLSYFNDEYWPASCRVNQERFRECLVKDS